MSGGREKRKSRREKKQLVVAGGGRLVFWLGMQSCYLLAARMSQGGEPPKQRASALPLLCPVLLTTKCCNQPAGSQMAGLTATHLKA